jgi:6-phosphogluconolactonase
MKRTLAIAQDAESTCKKGAQIICESAAEAIESGGRFTFVLAGGSTPKKLYEMLASPYFRNRVPWSKTQVFWGDERCVPPDHADSNFKMANDALISKVPIPANNIHRIPAEMESPREAAKAYEQSIKSFFGTSTFHFDLVLLGMGEDGHTASLFPGTAALSERMHAVAANYVERLSSNRITLTLPALNSATRVMFLCVGQSKAAIVREIFRDDRPADRYPAQLVQPQMELTWLLDESAASKLPNDLKMSAARV